MLRRSSKWSRWLVVSEVSFPAFPTDSYSSCRNDLTYAAHARFSYSDFVDVNVGYQFVNILYRNSDGSIGVDTDLINDVREQNGGGGEPLDIDD
jgi:hypothetical protein